MQWWGPGLIHQCNDEATKKDVVIKDIEWVDEIIHEH